MWADANVCSGCLQLGCCSHLGKMMGHESVTISLLGASSLEEFLVRTSLDAQRAVRCSSRAALAAAFGAGVGFLLPSFSKRHCSR